MSQPISNLEVGDKVKLGNYQVESETAVSIVWVVADKNHEGYPSSSVTLVTEKIIDLRGFDAGEAGNADNNRASGGNNRYRTSNLRQWLNSNGSENIWFTEQNLTDGTTDTNNHDAPPIDSNFSKTTGYAAKKGFLNYFSSSELSKILDTDLTVVKNTVTDGGGSEVINDKIFLLSSTEVGLGNENSIAEGNKLSLFNTTSNIVATVTQELVSNTRSSTKPYSTTDPWAWWLRTPISSTSFVAHYVYSNGSLSADWANIGTSGIRPALNIDAGTLVSDAVDSDGAYTLILPSVQTINADTKRIITSDSYETIPIDTKRALGFSQIITTDTRRIAAQLLDIPIDSKRTIKNSKIMMADVKRVLESIQIITVYTKRKVVESDTIIFDTLRKFENSASILIDTKRKVLPIQTINIATKRRIKVIQTKGVDTKRWNVNRKLDNFFKVI